MPSRAQLVNRANVMGLDPTTFPNDSALEQHVLYLETNATTINGTLATGTLTSDATPQSDGDQIKIGAITYTFKTALTETKASSTLTTDATAFADGERVVVEGRTYTFKTALDSPEVANQVLIGVSAAVSLDNLKSAINHTGTAGTDYSSITRIHSLVNATTNTDTTQVVVANDFGTYANKFITAETCAHASWTGTTLTGGLAPVQYEILLGADAATMLDNMKVAINNGATEGTNYSTTTKAHPQVTATTNTNTTQVVQARDMAVTNGSIATTDPVDTGSHMSWGATTLASGVADQNAVDATAVAQTSGAKNLNV